MTDIKPQIPRIRIAKAILWVATLASIGVLLAMTAHTHPGLAAATQADAVDDHAVAGMHAFERHDCNRCHTVLGFGAYFAPDLTRAYERLGEDTVRGRLDAPEMVFANWSRKMPRQHLARDEIEDLVSFLRWVSASENHDWSPQDPPNRWRRSTELLLAKASMAPAAAPVQLESCLACHALASTGDNTGPELGLTGGGRRDRK